MAVRNVYVAGGNGIGYTKEVDSVSDYGSVGNDTYFKDNSAGVGGLIMYKASTGIVYPIFATNSVSGDFVEVTNSELKNLITNGLVDEVTFYKVTDVQNCDEGVVVSGISTSTGTTLQGSGIFLNADYDGSQTEYTAGGNKGLWSSYVISVAVDDFVIWNNRHWKNLTGDWGSEPDSDSTNWELMDKTFENGHIREIDFVKYDVLGNNVIYRADKRGNEVEHFYYTPLSNDSISVFQWGKNEVSGNKVSGKSFMDIKNSWCRFYNNTLSSGEEGYYLWQNGPTRLTDNTPKNDSARTFECNNLYGGSHLESNINYGYVRHNTLYNISHFYIETNDSDGEIEYNRLDRSEMEITTSNSGLIKSNDLSRNSHIDVDTAGSSSNIEYNGLENSYISLFENNGVFYKNNLICGTISVSGINAISKSIRENTLDSSEISVTNNSGFIRRNSLRIDSIISCLTNDTNSEISYNDLSGSSRISISTNTYGYVNGNSLSNNSLIDCTSNSEGYISNNSLQDYALINIYDNQGGLSYNSLIGGSIEVLNISMADFTANKMIGNRSENIARIRIANDNNHDITNNIFDGGYLNISNDCNAPFRYNTISTGADITATDLSYAIQRCKISLDISADALTANILEKTIDSSFSDLDIQLDMTNISHFSSGTLYVPNEQFGRITLINGTGEVISIIDGISESYDTRFVISSGSTVDFLHTALSSAAGSFELLCETGATTTTLSSIYDFVEYRTVVDQCLRTKVLTVA